MMILSCVVVSLCDDVRMCGGWLACKYYCVRACCLLLVIFTGTFLAM